MKTLSLIVATLLIAANSFAQRVVALHSSGTVTMFDATDPFVAAYTAAVAGDTIYLPGGAFTAPATLDKQLFIIGAGVHPDSTTATYPTVITNSFILGDNADNIHIEGIEFPSFNVSNNVAVNGFLIRRCKINTTCSFSGDLSNPSTGGAFIGNIIIGAINSHNLTNSIFANNLFQNYINASHSNSYENNVFIRVGNTTTYIFENCNNNTIANNVFVNNTIYLVAGIGNIIQNNLIEYSSPSFGTVPVLIGNYINVPHADILVNQTGTNLDFTHDYHLVSPATYLGADGTEVGIYGGNFTFKDGLVPMNPHIRSANISSTTNAAGELQIEIEVGAQDN